MFCANTVELETQIDRFVLSLYRLTEIKIVLTEEMQRDKLNKREKKY